MATKKVPAVAAVPVETAKTTQKSPPFRMLVLGGGLILGFALFIWALSKRPAPPSTSDVVSSDAGTTAVINGPVPDPGAVSQPTGPVMIGHPPFGHPPGIIPPGSPPVAVVPPPVPVTTPAPTPIQAAQTYVVRAGDTLAAIARRFGLSTLGLGAANKGVLDTTAAQHGISGTSRYGNYDKAYDYIYPGETLQLPR